MSASYSKLTCIAAFSVAILVSLQNPIIETKNTFTCTICAAPYKLAKSCKTEVIQFSIMWFCTFEYAMHEIAINHFLMLAS